MFFFFFFSSQMGSCRGFVTLYLLGWLWFSGADSALFYPQRPEAEMTAWELSKVSCVLYTHLITSNAAANKSTYFDGFSTAYSIPDPLLEVMITL